MNMRSYKCCDLDKKYLQRTIYLSSLLKILAEGNRLRLLCILKQRTHCVCNLIKHFNLSQSLISHHLADLKKAGLVKDKKRGQRVYYSLTDKGKKITNLLSRIN